VFWAKDLNPTDEDLALNEGFSFYVNKQGFLYAKNGKF
jgi:hypothetical protein